MKTYGEVNRVYSSRFYWLMPCLEWSDTFPSLFIPVESDSVTHWVAGTVDPRAGLDDIEI
jgi:hypothetical protein